VLRLLAAAILSSCTCAAQESPIHSLTFLLEGDAFAKLPAGAFNMGSANGNEDERPVHRVRISRGFEIGKYEITQAQWDAVMRKPHAATDARSRSAEVNASKFKGPERPAENVSWQDVQAFIKALNARDQKHTYRLPTEAEWEYAARAGSSEERIDDLDSVAWYKDNSGGETHGIGQKKANSWGLHDMLGNVQEWVQDWYSPAYGPAATSTDPEGSSEGSYKVYRGCAWLSETKYCRPAYRAFDFPTQGQYSVGFRLVRSPK
jgi:formylglycine-generating enzyme required for sulfatase activity